MVYKSGRGFKLTNRHVIDIYPACTAQASGYSVGVGVHIQYIYIVYVCMFRPDQDNFLFLIHSRIYCGEVGGGSSLDLQIGP